jgi:hypothetical protein
MKKGLYTSIILVLIVAIIGYNFEKITNYIETLINGSQKIIIPEKNEYYKNVSYDFVKESKDFVPYSKQDLYNVFYSILNNGYNNFTFYCPEEYTDCINDVEKLSSNPDTLTNINNFVSPFNNFSNINVIYSTSGEVDVEITKLYSNIQISEINQKMDEIQNEIITSNMKTEDKILAVHDYIINHAKYDQDKATGTTKYLSSTAYGPLLQGYAVCGGYADSMALFLNRFGVKNFKVSSASHVWNAVYINNEWLNLDLTWDDPVTINSDKDSLLHKFYLIDTSTLESYNITDHEFDKTIYQELAS